MADFNPFEFCQYVEPKTGRRCVGAFGHAPYGKTVLSGDSGHDLQPRSSATVQSIERRETVLKRATDAPPTMTPEKLTAELDRAVEGKPDAASA